MMPFEKKIKITRFISGNNVNFSILYLYTEPVSKVSHITYRTKKNRYFKEQKYIYI